MKVLLINGSPRKEGNTFVALSQIASQLKENAIDSEIVWIGNKAIHGCIACGKCRQNGGLCAFDDDVCNEILSKAKEADALVFGSPVYYGQPAGPLLCLEQRMMYAASKTFANKPAAVVCVCRRGGATAAFQTLQMPLQMVNMPIVTSQYWNIAYGAAPGDASKDIEGLQTMRTLANNMAWMLKKFHNIPSDEPQREAWTPLNYIR